MTKLETLQLKLTATRVRMGVIEATHGAGCGHPGGSLSAADVLTYLYFREMRIDPEQPQDPNRDRFVLSKGHCAPGLCATLASCSFQRGVYVFGAALVISYVTFFMVNVLNFPSDMLIWFGILHLLGVCMMLFPLFKRLPVWALAVLGVAFVALGVWFESFRIPVNFLFPLGLRAQGFYCGGDYFPLLPGFGWFLLGAVIGRTAYRKKQSLLPRVNAANPVIRFFSFCGRHSLLIYMLHQPVLTIGTILIFG